MSEKLKKFLAVLTAAAFISAFSILTAFAQCPGGVCPQPQQPQVAAAPTPVFRAPVRRFLYEFMTPQGVVMQGYYVRPLVRYTPEQVLAQQRYWNEQAAKVPAVSAPVQYQAPPR